MFLGEYEHTIDDKGRVAIPARFREELSSGLVLTRSFDRCLLAFTLPHWRDLAQRISSLSLVSEEARTMRRLFFANAAELEMDRQGRILIPQSLRDYAGLAEQATVVGLDTHVELWMPARWREEQQKLESNGPHLADQMKSLGI